MILILASLLLSSILILIGNNYAKAAFILSILLLSAVGFLFDPYLAQSNGVYTDLVRFFNELQLIKNYNFTDVLTSSVEPFKSLYSGMLINNAIMFIVAKIGNLHLLPFLSVFAFYTILYLQIYKECKNSKLNRFNILIIFWLVYALINITYPMDNIRNPFASLVGAVLLYNNLVNKLSTPLTILGYIAIFLIHPSSIIFPIINLLVKINNKWIRNILIIITFFITTSSYQISSILLGTIPGGSILFSIIDKLNDYSGGQADLMNYGTTYQKMMLWLTAIVMIYILHLFNKQNKKKTLAFYNACIFFVVVFIASSLFSVHMFFRIGFILNILILLMMPSVLKNPSENITNTNIVNLKISISSFRLYLLLILTIIVNLAWYFGTYAYRSINLGG